ncbi:hypothetical protein PNA2_0340 [Pyrococcus sp. NA2]|uniref:DUF835 domain-containing protein n=1 Tax=Pyrococcus sp. (strain NA2) TaxID=342949 RepID=UPI000209A903|nr:DUF835 domain-containing protein [Pyrococcus sp. NA2]AEC51257.1 hypothetical protein PNA2_0340 [Pyrococcus sp. NA2]
MDINAVPSILALMYLFVFLAIRIKRAENRDARSLIAVVLVLISLAILIKGFEMFHGNVKVAQLLYSIALFGIVVALSMYIRAIETPPLKVQQVKVAKNSQNGSKLHGAYLISGSRARIVDVINMIRDINAPILIFTRYPSFYRNLGGNVKVIWVTQASEDGVPPTKLHVIQDYAIKFAKENGYAVVIIDCLEYLLLYNEFASVFKFLASLKDYLIMMNSALILAVDERALDEKHYTLLLNEFEPL